MGKEYGAGAEKNGVNYELKDYKTAPFIKYVKRDSGTGM